MAPVAPAQAPGNPAAVPGAGDAVTRKQLNRWGMVFLFVFLPIALISIYMVLNFAKGAGEKATEAVLPVLMHPWTWGASALLTGIAFLLFGFSARSRGRTALAWSNILGGSAFCIVGPVVLALTTPPWLGPPASEDSTQASNGSFNHVQPASDLANYSEMALQDTLSFDAWADEVGYESGMMACRQSLRLEECRWATNDVVNVWSNAWSASGEITARWSEDSFTTRPFRTHLVRLPSGETRIVSLLVGQEANDPELWRAANREMEKLVPRPSL